MKRFGGPASETGLEAFLGAEDKGHHWLLLANLDGRRRHSDRSRLEQEFLPVEVVHQAIAEWVARRPG